MPRPPSTVISRPGGRCRRASLPNRRRTDLRKIVSLLSLFLFLAIVPADAQTGSAANPQARADARQLVDLLKLQGMRVQIMRATIQVAGQRLLAANKGHEADVKSFVEQSLVPVVRSHEPEITEWQAQVFAQRFTAQELRQLLNFYRSGVGAKLLATMPVMMGDVRKFANNWATSTLGDAAKKLGPEAKKRGIVLPAS